MPIQYQQRVIVPDHVLFRELDGEAILLNLNNESYYGLDDVGTTMWQMVTAKATVQAAYDALLVTYAVTPDVLQTDLTRLITELEANGLLELVDG